jgi:hypothetical protein
MLSWLTKLPHPNLLALTLYVTFSIGLFGLRVLAHPITSYLGFPQDPGVAIWCLEWWPWAILHGHNPFYSHVVWAPIGFDLTWMTSTPGLSLLAAPITLTLGPVVAYNILAIAAPAVSAWSAYILCRQIVGAFWPSSFGGWVYGFSTYELNRVLGGQLCLSWILVPPLCIYLVLLVVQGSISARRFILYFTAALIFQFSIFHEVFATMTLFGAVVLFLAAILMPELRTRLYRTTLLISRAYALTAIIVSPFLYYFFVAHSVSRGSIYPPRFFSNDLLAVIIPGPLTWISRAPRNLPGNWENGAYLGPGLVTLIVSFALRTWHRRETKLLLIVLASIFLASLGPKLNIADHPTILFPWNLASYLPLLGIALPARFMLFAWLITAVIAAMWLGRADDVPIRARIALALLSVLFLFPSPDFLRRAQSTVDTPKFFSGGLYRRYIRPGENILIIPYSRGGSSMLWQAQTGMDFRMAGGWTGAAPADFLRWPIINALFSSTLLPDCSDQLKAFLATYQIGGVVVHNGANWPWPQIFATLGVKPIEVGGVALYNVPPETLRRYRDRSLLRMERREDALWFSELLRAAAAYLARGLEVRDLTPLRAARLGLLPAAVWADNLDTLLIQRRIGGWDRGQATRSQSDLPALTPR